MNEKLLNRLGELPVKDREVIVSYIESLEKDCEDSESRYKSLLEASKYAMIIKEEPKKKNTKLPYKSDVREYAIEKLWAMRDTLTPSELKILLEIL